VAARLVGAAIASVERRGKALIVGLAADGAAVAGGEPWCLLIHLKMTGQLVYVDPERGERYGAGHPSGSLVDALPDKSTRVTLRLDRGVLFFNDQRKFGYVKLLPRSALAGLDFFRGLGPEPLDRGFSAADLAARLARRPGTSVKAALLDQSVVAGVGNIYADECLWRASIHPATRVRALAPGSAAAILDGIREAMELSLAQGGSSSRNYVDAEGKRGAYLDFAAVYGRTGLPCRRCGAPVAKGRVAGRGTHWCPACQPEPTEGAPSTAAPSIAAKAGRAAETPPPYRPLRAQKPNKASK
jgi:formamidopyrimidine-DNA glycosylase